METRQGSHSRTMEASPRKGDWSDEPTGRLGFGRTGPSDGLLSGSVRTGSSDADPIEFCPTSQRLPLLGRSRAQSERGLDSAEWSPEGDPEARASGKSGAARSDRRETSGGSGGVPSAGWRAVAAACHASGGQGHE